MNAIDPKNLTNENWDNIFNDCDFTKEYKNEKTDEHFIGEINNCKVWTKTTEKHCLVLIYYPFGLTRHIKLKKNENLEENIKESTEQLKEWKWREKFNWSIKKKA